MARKNTVKRVDKKIFSRTAATTKKMNISPKLMRGGTRLQKGQKMEKTNDVELKTGEFIVVAVKDELTKKFMQPTFGDDLDALMRIFTYQINANPIWKDNASDFSFYILGFFNQNSGILIPDMQKICSGHSVVKKGD